MRLTAQNDNYWIVECVDGWTIQCKGNQANSATVGHLLKSDGWTRAQVEMVVELLNKVRGQ